MQLFQGRSSLEASQQHSNYRVKVNRENENFCAPHWVALFREGLLIYTSPIYQFTKTYWRVYNWHLVSEMWILVVFLLVSSSMTVGVFWVTLSTWFLCRDIVSSHFDVLDDLYVMPEWVLLLNMPCFLVGSWGQFKATSIQETLSAGQSSAGWSVMSSSLWCSHTLSVDWWCFEYWVC